MPSTRRLIISALLALTTASAHEPFLYASTVSYCSPPSELIIDTFDLAFFKNNHSVVYTLVAEATQSLKLSGRAIVNDYASTPVELVFDLCSLTSVICPLPQYTFNGSATIPIPPSFASRIPSIAYVVPDLEAFVQLELWDNDTNEVVACIQATASNGWSTKMKSVEWTIGGISIAFGSIVMILSLVIGPSRARTRRRLTSIRHNAEEKPPKPSFQAPTGDNRSVLSSEDGQETRVQSRNASIDALASPQSLSSPIISPSSANAPQSSSTALLRHARSPTLATLIETDLDHADVSASPDTSLAPNASPNTLAYDIQDRLTFTILRLQFLYTHLLLFLQHVVLTGLLHLNYPLAYSSFVLNFSWSFGLFPFGKPSTGTDAHIGATDKYGGVLQSIIDSGPAGEILQNAIDRMRAMTGAGAIPKLSITDGTDDIVVQGKWRALNPVLWGQRTLSPYNALVVTTGASSSDQGGGGVASSIVQSIISTNKTLSPATYLSPSTDLDELVTAFTAANISSPTTLASNVTGSNSQTPYITYADLLQPGIQSYVNGLGIPNANAAMSIWFSAIVLIAGFALVALIGGLISYGLARVSARRRLSVTTNSAPNVAIIDGESFQSVGYRPSISPTSYWSWGKHLFFGTVLPITLLPVTTLTFYQWKIPHDAWLPNLLTALLAAGIWAPFAIGAARGLFRRRENDDESPLKALPLPTFCIIVPSLLAKSGFAGFGQSSGWIQVIGLLATELLVLIATITYAFIDRRRRRKYASSSASSGLTSSPDTRRCFCFHRHKVPPSASPENHVLLIVLCLLRLTTTGLLIGFQESLTTVTRHIRPIPRLVIGIAGIVVSSVGMLLILFVTVSTLLWTLGPWGYQMARARRHNHRSGGPLAEDGSAPVEGVEDKPGERAEAADYNRRAPSRSGRELFDKDHVQRAEP
ncbi:hypothetical protein DL93DRAFT_2223864 [Clavulina sp. PMI_390]|nr:hypothetical protein DL93DRAFT_2223864 [Clavulina sp. PMI_390]